MFEYDRSSKYCALLPSTPQKSAAIYDVLQPDPSKIKDVYIMHCSGSQENLVQNSDFFTRSRDRKSFEEFQKDLIWDWKVITYCVPAWVMETMVLVTEVPMLDPKIIGIAFFTGAPADTKATKRKKQFLLFYDGRSTILVFVQS